MKTLSFFLFTICVFSASGRTFTSSDGKKIEAEIISASKTHVTLKLNTKKKEYTIPISRLSEDDQEFIAEFLKKEEQSKDEKIDPAAIETARTKIAEFALQSKGKKIGDGECWSLADEAFKYAKIKRPTSHIRVWGEIVDYKSEKLMPGDIVEFQDAVFKDGNKRGPVHTAVVVKKGIRRGLAIMNEQNVGDDKSVKLWEVNLKDLDSGKVIVYRYNGKKSSSPPS